jgi:hypothetical protein
MIRFARVPFGVSIGTLVADHRFSADYLNHGSWFAYLDSMISNENPYVTTNRVADKQQKTASAFIERAVVGSIGV